MGVRTTTTKTNNLTKIFQDKRDKTKVKDAFTLSQQSFKRLSFSF